MLCYVIISYTTRHLHPCISEHKYSGWFRTSGESIFVDIWNDICRARLLRQDEGNTEIRKTLLLVNDTYFDIKAIFSQDLSQPSYYKLIAWCFLYNIIVGVFVQCIQHSAARKMKRKFNKKCLTLLPLVKRMSYVALKFQALSKQFQYVLASLKFRGRRKKAILIVFFL